MSDSNENTRIDKFDKRRKGTKLTSFLMVLGVVILIVLIFIWLFGGNDSETNAVENNENNINIVEVNENNGVKNNIENEEDTVNKEENESNEENNENNQNDIEKEVVESSDSNVKQAYVADWEPIGTQQTGEHTTSFEKDSVDWIEMEQAAKVATGLDEIFTWWIGNNGPQKVVATVSHPNNEQAYRVYLSWIDNEGWQPTRVEELINNDKK